MYRNTKMILNMKKIFVIIAVIILGIVFLPKNNSGDWKRTFSGLTNDGQLIEEWEKHDSDTLFTKTIRKNFNTYEGITLDGSDIYTKVETHTKKYGNVRIREIKVSNFVCGEMIESVERDTTLVAM